jgi:hypothetical protein
VLRVLSNTRGSVGHSYLERVFTADPDWVADATPELIDRETLRPRQTQARLQAVPPGVEVVPRARAGAMPTAMLAATRCRTPIAT